MEAKAKRPIKRRTIIIGLVLTILLAGLAFTAGRALDYWQVVDTYWRVHDELMQPTEAGRYYIALFWQHNYELCMLIVDHPQVMDDGRTIILEFEPGLHALVEGHGDEVYLTSGMIDRVQAFLDLLIAVGSPELGAAIQAERARTPLDQFKGMTFEQARLLVVGPPEEGPIPTPIDWAFPRDPNPTPYSTGTP
jgi:hypothetical protein